MTSYPVQAGYDLVGNEINLWESSLARYYTYDAVGRLSNTNASSNASPPALTAHRSGLAGLDQYQCAQSLRWAYQCDFGKWLGGTSQLHQPWVATIGVGSVYSLSMGYAGNGNILADNDSVNGNWAYTYDNVNRLLTATGAGQNLPLQPEHEPFGNMTCSNTGSLPCTPLGFAISSATNQITTAGYTYDAAGNLLSDNTHGYVYDAENRFTCVLGHGWDLHFGSAMLYLYDAQGQRVGKQHADTLEDYVYDPQGHIISVHDGGATLLRSELYSPDGRHVSSWEGNT